MRKCVLCGKEYEYCPNCPKDSRKPLWHKLYHSENCRNIFEALNNYNFKLATKEETQEILSKCDLSIELNDHYRGEIEAIMPKKRGMRAKVMIVDEVVPEAEPVEEIKEEAEEEPNGVVITE